ncbi:MAG TPA: DUF2946 family protein [Burkholderiales bacterium]|nr:DUF2946 family protein [Burkholderiales bacterium]
MRRFLSPLRLAVALLAAAVSAVGPSLAHARLVLPGHSGYAEVCTVAGLKQVPIGAPASGDEQPPETLAHCALCVVSGGAQAPGGATPYFHASRRAERPMRFAPRESTPVEPVRAARPRGPPAIIRFA